MNEAFQKPASWLGRGLRLVAAALAAGMLSLSSVSEAAISFVNTTSATANNPTSGSWTLPAGWAPDDVAIFWWYTFADTKTITAPGTVTTKHNSSAVGFGRIFIGYRTLQSGDTSFAWTSTSVSNSTTVWGVSVFRGVIMTGDPFEAQSGVPATFSNAINPNPPAVTPVTTGAAAFAIFGKRNDYTSITPPTNYASSGENSSTSGSDASAGTAFRLNRTGGVSEDPPAWTLGGGSTADDGYVWTGALRPEPTAVFRSSGGGSGNWNDPASWIIVSGSDADGIPDANDTVEIAGGHTITLTANAAVNTLVFLGSGGSSNLTHNAGVSLTVGSGGVTINGSTTDGTKAWNINAGSATVNGPVTLNGGTGNARIARINLTTGSLDINGDLTMTATSSSVRTQIVATGAANVFVSGSFNLTNGLGTLTPGGSSTFTYDTSSAATVATGGAIAYNNLVINKSGGTATASTNGALTVNNDLTVQAGSTFNIPNINVTVGNETFIFGTIDFTVAGGTKTFSNDVYIRSGGTWNNTSNTDVFIREDLNLDSGGTFNAGNGTTTLAEDFYNNGTFNAQSGTVVFANNGNAGNREIGGSNAATFNNLTINKGTNTLTIRSGTPSPTVNGTFTLTAGRLITQGTCGSPTPIIIGATGTIVGGSATSYVQGAIRKDFSGGATLNFRPTPGEDEFPVGTASAYSPVEITAGGTTSAGNLTVCVTATDHPNIATSAIDAAKSVNRYWSLTNSGLNTTPSKIDATFKFVAGDVDVGANTGNFIVQQWTGSSWNSTTLVTAAATSTRAQNIDLTSGTNDIAIGEALVSAPDSFNAFESSTVPPSAITGVIKTKIAGAAFSLDVVAIQGGSQFSGFTDTVIVELLGNNTLGVSLDANNCPTTFTLVQTVAPNPTITGGRSTVNFAAVPDSWRDVRVRVRWPVASPTVVKCSSDNFAIRPDTFANFAVSDDDWQTAGTTRTLNNTTVPGGTVHKAGRPFTVRADAVNAAGTPAITANYTGSPTATLSACGGSACTGTFGALTLGTSFTAGQLNTSVASYDDVGAFNLQLVDDTFASVDTADSTPAERNITSPVISVGRFVPDNFAVALNTPSFGTTCGSFTYVGELFNYTVAPQITVTARNFAGGTTTRYTGALWQITNTSLTGKSYTTASGTLNTSGAPATDPVIADSGSGMGTLTFASSTGPGTGFFFARSSPVAPFDAEISLAINVIDADGVAASGNPVTFGAATPGNGIAFTAGKPMRFGRLVIRNASGSQLVPLPVPVEAQYWNGSAFITNVADSCTTVAASGAGSDVAMGSYSGNLAPGPGCKSAISGGGALSSGRRTLMLSAPGSANSGSVTLTVNLGAAASGNTCTSVGPPPTAATTANRPFLHGQWDGVDQGGDGLLYDDNPFARATFGVYRGSEEVIFIRENF